MYLLPFHAPEIPPDPLNGWKFFIVCDDEEGERSSFFDAMDALGEERAADFATMVTHFSKLALDSRPWEVKIPDKKRMHDVGEISLKHANGACYSDKVWSFKHSNLRILWCYGGAQRIILFGHVLAKDQPKIDPIDVELVEDLMQKYVVAYETGQIRIAGGEENEQTFSKLFPKNATKPKEPKKNTRK